MLGANALPASLLSLLVSLRIVVSTLTSPFVLICVLLGGSVARCLLSVVVRLETVLCRESTSSLTPSNLFMRPCRLLALNQGAICAKGLCPFHERPFFDVGLTMADIALLDYACLY